MGDFDLDLQSAENEFEETDGGERIVLGVLDGETPGEEWTALVEAGNTLVLDVEGDLTDLAESFAPEVKQLGGELMHFRGFLVVAPADADIDASRLG